jgi:hypothetical protein
VQLPAVSTAHSSQSAVAAAAAYAGVGALVVMLLLALQLLLAMHNLATLTSWPGLDCKPAEHAAVTQCGAVIEGGQHHAAVRPEQMNSWYHGAC